MRVVVLGNTAKHLLTFRGPFIFATADAGHEVIAIGPHDDPGVRAAFAARGVAYDVVPFDRTARNPVADTKMTVALTRKLTEIRPDLYFGYTIKPAIYGSIAAWSARIPRRFAMVTGGGYALLGQERWQRRMMTRLIKQLYRAGLATCHGVFFQNRDDLAEFEANGLLPRRAERIVVNGSGVDLVEFPRVPMPSTKPPIVLFVGRLLREKGIVEYVDAARIVRARRPDVRFQVLGHLDPNPATVSQQMVDGWMREGVVELLGEHVDVRPFLAAATTLVLPSYREGTPRSVLEALSTGRPIITTDTPGCRETVVDEVNGYLVPPYDSISLAAAILRLLDRPDLAQMAAASRALAERKYDARLVSASMLQAMGL